MKKYPSVKTRVGIELLRQPMTPDEVIEALALHHSIGKSDRPDIHTLLSTLYTQRMAWRGADGRYGLTTDGARHFRRQAEGIVQVSRRAV